MSSTEQQLPDSAACLICGEALTRGKQRWPRRTWRAIGWYNDNIHRSSMHWTRRGAERAARRMRLRHMCGSRCSHYVAEVCRVWR